jgi:NADH-quinone oxidoreductase subunit L
METLLRIFPANSFALLVVILGMPLIGAFVNGVFGKRLGKDAVKLMALTALGVSFLASLLSFVMLWHTQHVGGVSQFTWEGWKWMSLSLPREAMRLNAGLPAGTASIDVAFFFDPLNGAMSLIVTGIGFLIHLYSSEYMKDDPGFYRFFAYLNLFIFSMLVLILGHSLPILFVGWEGVGLCSYLLIGFWFDGEANASAGKKAFIVNRIGDFGLLVAMALLLRYTGALDWDGIEAGAGGLMSRVQVWDGQLFSFMPTWFTQPRFVSAGTLVALSLFLGCAGKSAQLPLYVWLPDAMAGPTPVSALIHAATMVTAGVYLVCRTAVVFTMSPFAMLVVAVIGVLTALLAASIALVQRDIKKVLAYSTVSQLGYMFLGVGVGAFTAGFFHVLTHAFFKACLFLGAGSVIHAMHARIHDTDASQDVRNMGGLRRYLPVTHLTFLVSVLAIAGLPFTSGFFSKDEILYSAYTHSIVSAVPGAFVWPSWVGPALFSAGVLGAVMTAFYMFRLYFLVFLGEFKGWTVVQGWTPPESSNHGHGHDDHGHAHAQGHDEHDDHGHGHGHGHEAPSDGPAPHESPWPMTLPLVVLAVLAAFGGFLNAAPLHIEPLHHWLEPVFAIESVEQAVQTTDPEHQLVWTLLVPGVAAFLIGLFIAFHIYVRNGGRPAHALAERMPGLYALLVDKWRVDELYNDLVVGTLDALADLAVLIDRWVVDGIIARLTSWLVAVWGHLLRLFQTGHTQVYAAVMVLGMFALGWFITAPHAQALTGGDAGTGDYYVRAAGGLGYEYRWDADGDGSFDSPTFGTVTEISLRLEQGVTRTVGLEVKNAFGRTATQSFQVSRPHGAATARTEREPTPRAGALLGAIAPSSVATDRDAPRQVR